MVGLNRTADRQRKEPFHSHLEHHYMQMSVSWGMLTPTLGVWHAVKTLESAHSQYLQCGFLKNTRSFECFRAWQNTPILCEQAHSIR